jgi:hypothetical protein
VKIESEFYLLFEVRRGWWTNAATREDGIREVTAVAVRQKKPTIPKGHVAVRVTLRFDRRSLHDSVPAIIADVGPFIGLDPELEVVA